MARFFKIKPKYIFDMKNLPVFSVIKNIKAMGNTNVIFILGDVLPTYYDVAVSLFSVATKPGSAKMKETIHKYAVALIGLWEKSFGYNHVMSRKSVVGRLEKLALNYYNKVYNIANRSSVKNKGEVGKPTSIRLSYINIFSIFIKLNKQWKSTCLEFQLAGKIFDFFIAIYCDI